MSVAGARIVGMGDRRYDVAPLDESTWPAFAALVEANNGIFGGCWCIGFHPEGCSDTPAVGPGVWRVPTGQSGFISDMNSGTRGTGSDRSERQGLAPWKSVGVR